MFAAATRGFAFAEGPTLPEPAPAASDASAKLVLAGNAAFSNGDLRAASSDYRAALRRTPGSGIAVFNLGLVEMHEGRATSGTRDMDRGIALAKQNGASPRELSKLRALRAAFSHPRAELT